MATAVYPGSFDPRACYFKQALYGKYVRMALIMTLLGVSADENR